MEIPDVAEFARNFSVMVRIQGPDPKALKMRNHAFHLHQSGHTTLSASGLLLPPGSLSKIPQIFELVASIHHHAGTLVITMASVIEPFLTAQHRDNPTKEVCPKLISGASIDVLVEGRKEGNSYKTPSTSPNWVPSHLLALVDVAAASDAIMSLVGGYIGSIEQASWEFGWSLASLNNDPRSNRNNSQIGNDLMSSDESYRNLSVDEASNPTVMTKSATRIAILAVSSEGLKDVQSVTLSQAHKRGDLILVTGSPFGALSPLHFYNSISVGSVANCFPAGSNQSSLLMADIHCLPGMEGAPVFNKQGFLTGILTRPLRQRGGTAEIQLVISWDAIATAESNELRKEAQRFQDELINRNTTSLQKAYSLNNFKESVKDIQRGPDFPCSSQSSLEKVLSSIALVTVDDGAWASGIAINHHGLILTNAHILESWRFTRPSLLGVMDKTTTERYISEQEGNGHKGERRLLFASRLGSYDDYVGNRYGATSMNSGLRRHKKISVRLHHLGQQMWYGARVVYVSEGPWDISLLQIESASDQVCPITPEFSCPATGSTIHVIGHGLLGPRSDASPSISSGVLANVVRIPVHLHESSNTDIEKITAPVMLQTTAAVHPGASGGAVVNSDGHLIGLVTSNARHGGGTIIPNLNFSIPCAALEPIFKFSENQDLSTLQVLDYPDELLSSIWALIPPPKSLHSPSEENAGQAKGSRFSQFLAEKHAEFTTAIDHKQHIRGKFPSKI